MMIDTKFCGGVKILMASHLLADAVLEGALVHRGNGGAGVVVHGGRILLVVHSPRAPSRHGAVVVLHLSMRLWILESSASTTLEREGGGGGGGGGMEGGRSIRQPRIRGKVHLKLPLSTKHKTAYTREIVLPYKNYVWRLERLQLTQ